MAEAVKNFGLFTVLHLFITTVALLVGLAMTMLVRGRAGEIWLLVIGFIPALSGILAWHFENRIANHRLGMFHRLSDAGVAAVRHAALIDLIVGSLVAAVLLGLGVWRKSYNQKAIIK